MNGDLWGYPSHRDLNLWRAQGVPLPLSVEIEQLGHKKVGRLWYIRICISRATENAHGSAVLTDPSIISSDGEYLTLDLVNTAFEVCLV